MAQIIVQKPPLIAGWKAVPPGAHGGPFHGGESRPESDFRPPSKGVVSCVSNPS
jgi:hypothetical protein